MQLVKEQRLVLLLFEASVYECSVPGVLVLAAGRRSKQTLPAGRVYSRCGGQYWTQTGLGTPLEKVGIADGQQ